MEVFLVGIGRNIKVASLIFGGMGHIPIFMTYFMMTYVLRLLHFGVWRKSIRRMRFFNYNYTIDFVIIYLFIFSLFFGQITA